MRAVAFATAVTASSATLVMFSDVSSVNTTTELSGRHVVSGDGARKSLAIWYSLSLAAAALMKPPTTCSGEDPADGPFATTRTGLSCTEPTSSPGCTPELVDRPPQAARAR